MTKTKGTKDFTKGPIFLPMLLFTLPLMATSILQLLYNSADKVIVGKFAPNGVMGLGAIGSTGSLTSLISALAIGLAVGAGVVVAQRYGARDDMALSRAVHTVFLVGLCTGIIIGVVGVLLADPLLSLMGTKPDLHSLAVLYMRIIFLGMPASVLYNFGSAVLRSVGDSKTPLIILASTGLLNVGLNLVFVIGFHMSVEGVAIATIVAQYVSALVVWLVLARREDSVRFRFSALAVERRAFLDIIRIGVPSGLQSSVFGFANVLLQSAVNTFPDVTVAGNAIGSDMEGFTYVAMNSYYQAVLTFTGQNVGAKQPERVKKTLLCGLLQVTAAGLLVSYACIFFSSDPMFPNGGLLSLFLNEGEANASAVIAAARERNSVVLSTYVLCGIMEVLTGHLRGRGCSVTPMISSVFCSCVLRMLWVWFVFPLKHTLAFLFLCYPLSWILTNVCHAVTAVVLARRERRGAAPKTSEASAEN